MPQHGGLAGGQGSVIGTDHSQTSEAATIAQTHPNRTNPRRRAGHTAQPNRAATPQADF